MKSLRLAGCVVCIWAALARAGDAPAPAAPAAPKPFHERLAEAGVKLIAGPAKVALGSVAELRMPEGTRFVGPDSIKLYYQLTQNQTSGKEVGVFLGQGYALYFDYDDSGYVKDDEKKELDADKLMKTMMEADGPANEERKRRGWDEIRVKGWATKPYYDEKTNNLKWAINLASSRDQFQALFINESIRLLGRGGVMNVTLVTGAQGFKAAEADADKLLASSFGYIGGQKYSEFKPGDKVAAYGLSALVLGGGAIAAAKLGWLGAFGVWLGKMWKMVVAGLVAVGVAIKKLFGKVTGARADDTRPPMA